MKTRSEEERPCEEFWNLDMYDRYGAFINIANDIWYMYNICYLGKKIIYIYLCNILCGS